MTDSAITTKETLESLDIEKLTLNPNFGSLTFDKANKKLEKVRNWLIEFEQLGYNNKLPDNIVSSIDQTLETFNEHIKWLENFDIKTSSNPKQEHDSFENQIDNFYNNFYSNFVVNHLNYLRQEAESQSKDKKGLAKEQKELAQIRENYEELVAGIRKETEEISRAKGERAAKRFGKHFEAQAKKNSDDADRWLKLRDTFFWALVIVIVLNLLGYFGLFIGNKLNHNFIEPREFFTLEYGLAKLALLSILSYGVSFSSRNFNINSNLSTLNKHRKNVAETLNDFLESEIEKEERSRIVENATEAMFRHQPIGYLPKIESKDDGPIASIWNILKPGG